MPYGDVVGEQAHALRVDVAGDIQITVVNGSAQTGPGAFGQGEISVDRTTGRTQPARRIEAPNHHEIGIAPVGLVDQELTEGTPTGIEHARGQLGSRKPTNG